jgi:hypothetical protein
MVEELKKTVEKTEKTTIKEIEVAITKSFSIPTKSVGFKKQTTEQSVGINKQCAILKTKALFHRVIHRTYLLTLVMYVSTWLPTPALRSA